MFANLKNKFKIMFQFMCSIFIPEGNKNKHLKNKCYATWISVSFKCSSWYNTMFHSCKLFPPQTYISPLSFRRMLTQTLNPLDVLF